ncbi:hypothetical protein COX85_01490 [Candidatus Micrarchaeota archaeon CG_4_10_14_0_2_um_filter_55_9]|nr:MAG: hypothetical protein AUJ15_02270 [Candidatus Micrarchaeota archaeon CG1_02_55_41]PIO02662.1 MAG: hypothetical protein COT57_02760 [Candidatus Micrarchaeota archaeon CG09_land_8_20_14_0_10_55_25]PIZ91874.1 MAG: hypothetical protein COX85_01490 [Candidatus Micrarchaeota archaeon CG_4_10_14_0_2_um_filter_55_9]PJD01224.1 MAG: hypothetical protein COU38_02085 [Candidatus Micrarchaeota archaeon CG10_big_fil_rev_8_21_14_0_10_54_18]
MKRVPTGVLGLDELMGGGLPENSVTLLVGATGTGKTVFATQFAFEGALRGEKTIFAGFNESAQELRESANSFGFNPTPLEKKGKLLLFDCSAARAGAYPEGKGLKPHEEAESAIMRECTAFKARQLVIDSFTPLAGERLREQFHSLSRRMKLADLTVLVVAEPDCAPVHEADNVIFLGCEDKPCLRILKLRGSLHSTRRHPYAITSSGFAVQRADFQF